MDGVLDFFGREAGQRRRAALDEFGRSAEQYVPPELRQIVGLLSDMTPNRANERAAMASDRLFQPDRTVGQRVGDFGEMASEIAGVVAPVAVAGRAGMPAAEALQEALMGFSAGSQQAGRAVAGRLNQPGPVPTMYSNPLMGGNIRLKPQAADDATATGIRAYHGSPHSFDKFSMDAIGTGEGAQAYGHGLYFAENEGVAKKYRDDLSGWSSAGAERTLESVGGDVDRAILETQQKLDRLIERSKTGAFQGAERNFNMQRQIQEDKIAQLEKYKRTGNFDAGSMYEVNINANPEDFLDWDSPAPQQSDRVRKALTSIANSDPEVMSKFREAMARGDSGSIYEAILQDKTGTVAGNQAGAARRLRESGILGIKYKDAGSRGTDAATRNYVVFDENLINIVKKYGIAGAAAMLGVSAMDVEQAMAQGAPQPQPQGLLGGSQ